MENTKVITIIASLIIPLVIIVTLFGIFSDDGPGNYTYESIRGKPVEIHGKGIYQHMSADVAIQGIAQDYITLFVGVPLFLLALLGVRKGLIRSRFLLAGTLFYFFVTYLFYTAMGMYNMLFLVYVVLLGLSFFGLAILLLSFHLSTIERFFDAKTPTKPVGGFLIVNSIMIALLWLGVIVPPLIDGSIYPEGLQHYTTLIVQGFDLGLLLPLSFVSGLLLIKRYPSGYLFASVYIIFLSILMTSLTAKIIAMAINGVNVIPAIFIIPIINLIAIFCAISIMKHIQGRPAGTDSFDAGP